MRKLLLSIAYLLGGFLLNAQNETVLTKEAIDQQISTVAKLWPAGKTEEVIPMAQQAYEDAQIIGYKEGVARAGMVLMFIYFNAQDFDKTIEQSLEVERIAAQLKDYNRLSNALRLKGLSYLELGLTDSGEKEIFNSLDITQKMNPSDEKHYRLAMIYDNLGSLMEEKHLSDDSIQYYKSKSSEQAELIDDNNEVYRVAKYSLMAFQNMNFGLHFQKRNLPEKAEEHFLRSIQIYDTYEGLLQSERITALSKISEFYLEQMEFEKAIAYAETGLNLEKGFKSPAIRENLYDALSAANIELGNREESEKFFKLSRTLSDSLQTAKKSAINSGVSNILEEKEIKHKASQKKYQIILFIGLLLLSGLVLMWYMHIKKIRKKYEDLISKLENQELFTEPEEPNVEEIKEEIEIKTRPELGIQDDTLHELLAKLNLFEKSKDFIKPEMSLVYLCNYLETNTKYLSYILKNNKQKTYSQYINDLRIDYLVKKLYKNPKFLEYKVEHLGELCGFQSKSAFNKAFKNATGLTPSYFIKRLKEDKGLSESEF